jgi:PKD repeat protein
MIPKINYPQSIDTDQNLFYVSDGLRVVLAEDYNPGDTSISIVGDEDTIRTFDTTGIITLTEQCSDPELRALSFYYSSRTLTSFNDLELLPGFIDCPKPKRATNVTQNVVSIHHNNLKDALIKIERFAGKKGDVGKYPLEGTMEERINYLRKLVLAPRAWFKVDKVVGLSPLTVEFTDQSFFLGTDGVASSVKHEWNFGDDTDDQVYCPSSGVCKVQKTYTLPGIYDVSLTVTNDFGSYQLSDTVVMPKMINVRVPAPDEATIEIVERSGQKLTQGDPLSGDEKPYTNSKPTIRAPINTLIDVKIKDEQTRLVPGSYTGSDGSFRSYSGEVMVVDGDGRVHPLDPVSNYTWSFSDDLVHNSSKSTKALFGSGGYFDLILRVDTENNAYRITTYNNAFDIIENYNLWLWYRDSSGSYSYEFGIISETFKLKGTVLAANINSSFLNSSSKPKAKDEFLNNNGAIKRSSNPSGGGGTSLIYWASGRDLSAPINSEKIVFSEFNGFFDTYTSRGDISRPWNWVGLSHQENLYFLLGSISDGNMATSQQKTKYNALSFASSNSNMISSNYKNGADELTSNTLDFTYSNLAQAYFSVYRTAWHEDSGYILRNEGGLFYRISSFYKTSGNAAEPFVDIRKITDMPGSKIEGNLTSLSQGVYFFNNSGSVVAYSPTSGSWVSGGPGSTSTLFRSLQDTQKTGFDDASNTLISASDGERIVFLSYNYSSKCFIKFNEADMTFKSLVNSPERDENTSQWQMYIF